MPSKRRTAAGRSQPQPEQDAPAAGATLPVARRIGEWAEAFHLAIQPHDSRPDDPPGDVVYLVKDIFTTRDGSWEPGSAPGSIPQWARDAYLSGAFLEAGASRNLFAAVIGLDGQFVKDAEILFWSDGFQKLGDPAYAGYVRERTKEQSGWANMAMFGGSYYDYLAGQSGPWCWTPAGPAEVVCGGGLPGGFAVSTFVVWQAFKRSDLGTEPPPPEPEPEPPPPPEPEPEPPPPEPEPEPPPPPEPEPEPEPPPVTVERRMGSWTDYLNVSIKTIAERPDHPPVGNVIFVIKDVFTTRDGSWEPSNVMGSVDAWARDAYLKPFGAPDYFDDAGADHHIFAHVLGLDGKPIPEAEIVFWSDGFHMLGDPAYDGWITRTTKPHSGWANIPIEAGSNFVPERGESGPWCWAPRGAAEVFCGGGMPAKNHVSFFVVWQAVRAPSVTPPPVQPPDLGDYNTWLPIVIGGAGAGQGYAAEQPPAPAAPDAPRAAQFLASPGPGPLTPQVLLRSEAWLRLGIEPRPDSPLAVFARARSLGMPVTQEFEVAGYRVQGFQLAIVYAPVSDPARVDLMPW